jgi:YVTN family beta-propeller protein
MNMHSNFHFRRIGLVLLSALSVCMGCRRDRPEPPAAASALPGNGPGVYITNEGNFQWGNASVSYYDAASGEVTEDLYAAANGSPLGDVCQSIRLVGSKAWIVVNNSGKVVEVDAASFVAVATVPGFSSPRYFLPVGANKAYVTDMAGGALRVVDMAQGQITGSIPCGGVTQELVTSAGKVFVANESRSYVYVVDPATDAVTDSVPVSRGGGTMAVDAAGMVWIGCTGGGGTAAALYRINAQTLEVSATVPVPGTPIGPWRLRSNATGEVLYLLNGGVYRLGMDAAAFPASPLIPSAGRNLYGLGVDPASGTLYVSDAVDYVQRGVVYRYAPDGAELGHFLAGRIPNGFAFR